MDALIDLFASAQEVLFETVFQPLAFAWGLASRLEDVYAATGWLLIGLLQIAVMLAVIGPLQRWRPVESVTDSFAVRTDVFYTLIHRLGLFRLCLFFSVDPLMDELMGHLRSAGFGTFHLDRRPHHGFCVVFGAV
jgi:sterol desaturase/sphingolipid hydroxylase (fatty acid hydroxylase superfamily)